MHIVRVSESSAQRSTFCLCHY